MAQIRCAVMVSNCIQRGLTCCNTVITFFAGSSLSRRIKRNHPPFDMTMMASCHLLRVCNQVTCQGDLLHVVVGFSCSHMLATHLLCDRQVRHVCSVRRQMKGLTAKTLHHHLIAAMAMAIVLVVYLNSNNTHIPVLVTSFGMVLHTPFNICITVKRLPGMTC